MKTMLGMKIFLFVLHTCMLCYSSVSIASRLSTLHVLFYFCFYLYVVAFLSVTYIVKLLICNDMLTFILASLVIEGFHVYMWEMCIYLGFNIIRY